MKPIPSVLPALVLASGACGEEDPVSSRSPAGNSGAVAKPLSSSLSFSTPVADLAKSRMSRTHRGHRPDGCDRETGHRRNRFDGRCEPRHFGGAGARSRVNSPLDLRPALAAGLRASKRLLPRLLVILQPVETAHPGCGRPWWPHLGSGVISPVSAGNGQRMNPLLHHSPAASLDRSGDGFLGLA